MADPTDLHQLAEEVLAASVEALDTIPTFSPGLAGAPERSFVSGGRPAFDNCCGDTPTSVGGQLTVNAQFILPKQVGPTLTGTDARIQVRVNLVTFSVTIVRCVPTTDDQGEAPPVEWLEDASAQTDADAWALWNHLWNMVRAGALLSICQEVFFDGMRALDPSGGCGGWVLSLRAELGGYEESIST